MMAWGVIRRSGREQLSSLSPHAIHDEIHILTFVLLGSWLINEKTENFKAFRKGRRTDCESQPFVCAEGVKMCCFRFSLSDGLWTRTRGENIHELCNLIKLWLYRYGNPNKTVQPWLWTVGQPQQFQIRSLQPFSSLSRNVLEQFMNYSASNWFECIKPANWVSFRWI